VDVIPTTTTQLCRNSFEIRKRLLYDNVIR